MVNEYQKMPAELILKSLKDNSMLMNISSKDMELIACGQKSVIVQRKLPREKVISDSIRNQKHPKIYLLNKNVGVFGECICELSFDNMEIDDKSTRKKLTYIAYGEVDKIYRDMYKNNPEQFDKEIERLNSKISLSGTCLSYNEFRNQVGIGNYIFFIIRSLTIYAEPLQLDDFYIARWGRNGCFDPAINFKSPRGWCYAVRKTEKLEEMIKQYHTVWG